MPSRSGQVGATRQENPHKTAHAGRRRRAIMPAMLAAKISPEPVVVPPIELLAPATAPLSFVCASPHSGTYFPADFVQAVQLDELTLRRSEDSFVDEIFAAAPALGAPLLKACFARAYCDVNREPYELDPGMFEDPLPAYVNTTSSRVAGGLGTIARTVGGGSEIYRRKLTFAEAANRIELFYRPYHAALARALEQARQHFGYAILIDCHSMPSVGGPLETDQGRMRPDIVLGDRYGSSCAPALTQAVEQALTAMGYRVARNRPYAGGFTTRHYGRPAEGLHSLQIEINRGLYMDEARIERAPGLAQVTRDMTRLIGELAALQPDTLRLDPVGPSRQ